MKFPKFRFKGYLSPVGLEQLWLAWLLEFNAMPVNYQTIAEMFSDSDYSDSSSESSASSEEPAAADDATVWNSEDELEFDEMLAGMEIEVEVGND